VPVGPGGSSIVLDVPFIVESGQANFGNFEGFDGVIRRTEISESSEGLFFGLKCFQKLVVGDVFARIRFFNSLGRELWFIVIVTFST